MIFMCKYSNEMMTSVKAIEFKYFTIKQKTPCTTIQFLLYRGQYSLYFYAIVILQDLDNKNSDNYYNHTIGNAITI